MDSLLENVRFSEGGSDEAYRAELYEFAKENGNEALHARLAEADPEAAAGIHPNNTVRVVRALEVLHITGHRFSELKAESRLVESPYRSAHFRTYLRGQAAPLRPHKPESGRHGKARTR